MFFFIKRLRYRLIKNRLYALIALIPPLIFLGIMASKPSMFSVSHSFSLPDDAPVAKSGSPTDSILVSELTGSTLQIGQFIRGNYFPQLILDYPAGHRIAVSQNHEKLMYDEATTNLTIRRIENNHLLTTYTGPNRELGELLVAYYGKTLFKRIQEGYKRRNITLPAQFNGTPHIAIAVKEHRSHWDSSRTAPSLMFFAAGLLLFLFSQVISELRDPSYKSEKQIAEHTQLPILGSLPNLNTATSTAVRHHDI